MQINEAQAKAVLALERRFGRSLMPYDFLEVEPGRLRVTDTESGSWIEVDYRAWRIRVVDAYDAMVGG